MSHNENEVWRSMAVMTVISALVIAAAMVIW
jgi:hypothetical protein